LTLRSLQEQFPETVVIGDDMPAELEPSRVLRVNESVPVFFEHLNGQRAAGNLWSTRERICRALGVDQKGLMENMVKAMEAPSDPMVRDSAPFMERRLEDFDLREMAIPKYYPADGGRYITSAVVIGELNGVRNLSFHRMMILDEHRTAIRLVPRDLYKMHMQSLKEGKDLKVAVVIGLCPTILLPASMRVDYGVDELRIANSLRRLCLDQDVHVVVVGNGVTVPAYAEIVMEGRITGELADEGPFVDITGTVDKVRRQPILEIDAINQRDNPIMQLILPGGAEHRILMGMPREPVLLSAVSKVVPRVTGVHLTRGGCGWLHGIIAIATETEGDAERAGRAALEAHGSMKNVVVVDEDIDVFDPVEVEWAVATRFQPHRDIIILENCKGSSLDPSAEETTSKMIIDATIKGTNRKPFYKADL